MGSIGCAVVVIINKKGFDLFSLVFLGWMLLSFIAITKSSETKAIVVWNIILLVADSIVDIFSMGTHLPQWLQNLSILPFQFSSSSQIGVISYWVLLWGIALPNRTLAMLDTSSSIHLGKIALFTAVIGLHITFVEDVIYFALLGYPPFASTPPQNYSYLPHLFGIHHWTAPLVWKLSSIGCAVYVLAAVIAIVESKKHPLLNIKK
jgi:hypothetical protein